MTSSKELPYLERDPDDTECGVLLSDRIEYYCGEKYQMIQPFDRVSLRPAGYNLRVGDNYAIRGEHHVLDKGGSLRIPQYQVAIIQTLETLNLPRFLIGRWNIRVSLAYEGLLWVGGAQVDPGFRGHLSCPIYNLSTREVTLRLGDELAMIDFVTTTSFRKGVSQPFKGKRFVFQHYNTELESGVAKQLDTQDQKLKESERLTEEIRARIDRFVGIVFTVVAVLFAALGIVATRDSEGPSIWSSAVWLAAAALYFALRAYWIANRHPREDGQEFKWRMYLMRKLPDLVVVVLLVGATLWALFSDASFVANEVKDARTQASSAMTAIEQQQRDLEGANERIESLQQQLDALRQGTANQ